MVRSKYKLTKRKRVRDKILFATLTLVTNSPHLLLGMKERKRTIKREKDKKKMQASRQARKQIVNLS